MGQITPNDLAKNLLPGLQTVFQKAYKEVPTVWQRLATVVDSNKASEDYAWLGQPPAMREFGAERIPKGLSEFTYTIRNKKYENSIRVDADALEDEQYGQIKTRVQQLAQVAARFPEKLVVQLIRDGFTTLCYDGQYFFDTDHSENNSGTQSNKGTTALDATAYGVARAAMANFKDDQGEPIGVIPDVLLVPPALEATAKRIVNQDISAEGSSSTTNIWKGTAEVLMSPYLTDATDWFLFDTKSGLKPVIYQKRTDVKFTALEENSESGFFRDAYHYGTRLRANVGFGDWRTGFGAAVAG